MSMTGRCYCGYVSVSVPDSKTVSYCHCADCRRWTGSASPVFAAFETFKVDPDIAETQFPSGVSRRNCPECGSPISARFPYLPGLTYVPVGILDQADSLTPELHSHWDSRLSWIHAADDLPKEGASARDKLMGPSK